MLDAAVLVRVLVDPLRQEELLGDLEELRTRGGRLRLWYDVVSVCVRQHRWRRSRTRFAAAAVVVTASLLASTTSSLRTVHAVDPGGEFTLEFEGARVVAATLDGAPLPAERLVQAGGRLVILGAGHGSAGASDLRIRVRPDGSIYWRARNPESRSPQH